MDDFSEPINLDEEITEERAMHHLKCMGVDCGWRADEVEIYIQQLLHQIDLLQRMNKHLNNFADDKRAQESVLHAKVHYYEAVISRAFQAKNHTLCLDELEKARMHFGSLFQQKINDVK